MAKALVLYHSQEYGNTAEMAKAVAGGLEESGCTVDSSNTNDGRFDVTKFPQYDGVAIGSPELPEGEKYPSPTDSRAVEF